MPRQIKKDSTSQTLYVFVVDSDDGSPETGITIANLDLQYVRFGAAPVAKVDAIELATIDGTHENNKMKEVDGTDQPGLYRVDWPDAAFATGVNGVVLTVSGTGFQPAHTEIELTSYDPYDAVRMGMTALPDAAADGVGGLPISDTGGLDLDTKLANTNEVTAARMGALDDWINDGRLDAILDIIAADVVNVDGSSIPTAATIATAVMAKVVDGSIDVTECLTILLAVLGGDMAKSGNTYTHDDQSGSVKVTSVVSASAVERTIA